MYSHGSQTMVLPICFENQIYRKMPFSDNPKEREWTEIPCDNAHIVELGKIKLDAYIIFRWSFTDTLGRQATRDLPKPKKICYKKQARQTTRIRGYQLRHRSLSIADNKFTFRVVRRGRVQPPY